MYMHAHLWILRFEMRRCSRCPPPIRVTNPPCLGAQGCSEERCCKHNCSEHIQRCLELPGFSCRRSYLLAFTEIQSTVFSDFSLKRFVIKKKKKSKSALLRADFTKVWLKYHLMSPRDSTALLLHCEGTVPRSRPCVA